MNQNRWSVERDVDDDTFPHLLNFDGGDVVYLSDTQADEMERLLALDAPSDLPAGVHRAPDGTLWLLVEKVFNGTPEGWEWANHVSWDDVGDDFTPLPEPIMVEVRPVALEPVRVPWGEALRDQRSVIDTCGEPLRPPFRAEADETLKAGVCLVANDGSGATALVDADGMVEVLPEAKS